MVYREAFESTGPGTLAVAGGKASAWLRELRLPFLVVTVLPVLFGAAVARSQGMPVDVFLLLLALAGAAFMHLGANVINDYFDYRNGTDAANSEYVRGFTGGSRVIQDGLLSHREVLAGAALLLAAAAFVIVLLAARTGPALWAMGIAALLAALLYSLFLHAVVAGELVVGFCFGTLIPAGSFFAQAGRVGAEVIFASVPLGLLVFLILFINEIPDYTADRKSGKITLVVRLGRRRAASLYAVTLAATYAYIAVMAGVFRMPVLLLSLVSLPVAAASSLRLLWFHEKPGLLRPSIVATIALFTFNGLVLLAGFVFRSAA